MLMAPANAALLAEFPPEVRQLLVAMLSSSPASRPSMHEVAGKAQMILERMSSVSARVCCHRASWNVGIAGAVAPGDGDREAAYDEVQSPRKFQALGFETMAQMAQTLPAAVPAWRLESRQDAALRPVPPVSTLPEAPASRGLCFPLTKLIDLSFIRCWNWFATLMTSIL